MTTPTINDVIAAIRAADDAACGVAGVATQADTLAAANAAKDAALKQVATLQDQNTVLQGKVDTLDQSILDALAEMDKADAGDAAEDAARANARAKLKVV